MAVVTYFAGRGLAEFPRWLLAATGESFTNKVLYAPEELSDLRVSGALAMDQVGLGFTATPLCNSRWTLPLVLSQLPLLQIDGLNIVQSGAIVRYIARKHGLDGATPDDKAKADVVRALSCSLFRLHFTVAYAGLRKRARLCEAACGIPV